MHNYEALPVLGQPHGGKSQFLQNLIGEGKLLARDEILLFDAEEGTHLSVHPMDPDRIEAQSLDSEEDFASLITLMIAGSKTKAIGDTPGSSQRSFDRILDDPESFEEASILLTPIIVIGTRSGALETGLDWLKRFVKLPRIFIVWNDQTKLDVPRTLPETFPDGTPLPLGNIDQIRIPHLQSELAKALHYRHLPAARLLDGPVGDDLLDHPLYRGKVLRWRKEVHKALKPLLDHLGAGQPPIEPSTEDSTPAGDDNA